MVALAVAAATLTLAWQTPRLLGWNDGAALDWLAGLQLAGPVAAAVAGGFAAWLSSGSDRAAWTLIAAAAVLYVIANLGYIALAIQGESTFPTPIDAAFFLMAILVGLGIAEYSRVATTSRTIDLYNFLLLYGAVVIASFFLLHFHIKDSQLSEFATLVAFAYPALWCSVAAYSALVLVLYPHGKRSLPLTLLIVAVLLEGIADFRYATQLMSGTYRIGGWPHLLWMLSAMLVAWAAVEHALIARKISPIAAKPPEAEPRQWVQAVAPAAILLIILLSGSITGAFGRGLYQPFSAALALGLGLVVGLREHRIIATRNSLQTIADERSRRLQDSEHQLASVLESTSDAVIAVDPQWRVRYFNRQAISLVPELANNGIGAEFWSLFRPGERGRYGDIFEKVLLSGEPFEEEILIDTRSMWLDLRVYSTGSGVSLFFRDISEQRRAREDLAYLAHHDYLTGLHSRSVFSRRVSEAKEAGDNTAVLLVDLDSFKEINDTRGHAMGDAILVKVAKRLRACVPPDCLLARLGGDEFAVVASGRQRDEVIGLGRRILQEFAQPFVAGQQSLVLSASIGIASTETATGEDLFTQADIALYEAKEGHRGTAVVFEPAMGARIRHRTEMLADLSAAIANNQLELAFQPMVDTARGRTVGFEALIRWRHPLRGLVGPDQFIPLAEESGLITGIGEWVLRAACTEALNWPSGVSVSVNLSTRQLSDEGLPHRIVRALDEIGLDHGRLELEVTESALLRDSNLAVLKAIEDQGIRIALDDFGTGYSSLSYLQRVPFSKLKIDRSFIANVPDDEKSKAIIHTIADLARTLGMRVTAEGVETDAQLEWVARHCDQAQGYFISRPMPAKQIADFLQGRYPPPVS